MKASTSLTSPLVLLLLLGASTLLTAPYAGAGVGTGWDLSQAHASFLPGDGDHRFGYRLAFAGDVDGDGLDDILISAWDSDGVLGYQSGRTYLYLGREDGWSANMTASEADASFYGETIGDQSGYSVAGVGDLDGDGLDDFVISGPSIQNPLAGGRRGRAYLFYGNASGWSLDTNLSSADQTFNGGFVAAAGDVNGDGHDDLVIGKEMYHTYAGSTTIYFGSPDRNIGIGVTFSGEEYYEDYSGLCVAGAGDVNGDGYDDVLVGSRNRDGGGASAGKTYLVLGRASGWPYSLKTADASFVGTLHDASGTALAGVGDVNGDGYDDFLINAYYNRSHGIEAGMTHLFLGRADVWATNTSLSSSDASFHGERPYDHSGMAIAAAGDVDDDGYDDFWIGSPDNDESGEDAGQVYLVLGGPDGWAPDTNISDAADASFLGECPEGRAGVWLAGGGDANGDGTVDVLIGAYNGREDEREFGKAYLVLLDYAPPRLTDRTPPVATTGDRFTISVDATDTSGVADIAVEHWFGDSPAHTNESTALVSGDRNDGTWALDVAVPPDSLEPLHYFVSAVDDTGLWNRTEERTVNVTDDDGPTLEPVETPPYVTTGQTITIEVNVSDNIGVQDVRFWCSDPISPHVDNISMMPVDVDLSGNGLYAIDNITVPLGRYNDLVYTFLAVDTSGNWNQTWTVTVDVLDDDPPWLEADLSDAVAYTGTPFEFALNASDNIGVSTVYVEYWFGDDPDYPVHTRMARVLKPHMYRTYNLSIVIPLDSIAPLSYHFSVSDVAGNWNVSAVVTVNVIDDVAPIARAGDDVKVGMNETFRLDGTDSTDNVGIVRHEWTLEGGEVALQGAVVTHALAVPGSYTFTLAVEDAAGSTATDTVVVTVLDTEPPVAVAGENLDVAIGTLVTLDGSASTDNVGVARWSWWVEMDLPPGPRVTLNGSTVQVLLDEPGRCSVKLLVWDVEGNVDDDFLWINIWDRTPPVAVAGGDINATAGDHVTLNASGSSDDVGIASWTWTIEHGGRRWTLEGESVGIGLDAPGEYRITLNVTDAAGNSAEDTLTITAEEAPPPPDGDGREGPGELLMATALVIALAVALAAVLLATRRRAG